MARRTVWKRSLTLKAWPHRYANVRQPRWYGVLRYWLARAQMNRVPVSHFPEGGAYACSRCERTFPDHYARNVHQWRDHPGCPACRIEDFHEWVRSSRAAFHSCRCRPEDCERGCHRSGHPFRRV